MSNVVTPARAAAIKSALESAFIALLASGVCLWFLISGTQGPVEDDPAKLTMCALGLAIGLSAHFVYMTLAARRAGRNAILWVILMLVLMPFTSVVLHPLQPNQVTEMGHQADELG